MRTPFLVEYYRELPQLPESDEDWFEPRHLVRLEQFRRRVAKRYGEGTLLRMLDDANAECRRAAVLALSLMGDMSINGDVAARLRDEDPVVRKIASDALWSIWFRGDSKKNQRELRRVLEKATPQQVLRGLDQLVQKSGGFAEAYNQRAILFFRLGEFRRAIADCEQVLKLNPHHFGAAAGMAQCYMKMRKPRAALRSFRTALRINPNLDDVKEAIRTLEEVLGEE